MIYLACPFTHRFKKVEAVRAHEASLAAAYFIRKGDAVFSPLSHSAAILQAAGDRQVGTWETWMAIDLEIIAICKKVVVLGLEGWHGSKGVLAEIEHAIEIEVPVVVVRNYALSMPISLSRAAVEDLGTGVSIPGIPIDNGIEGSRP